VSQLALPILNLGGEYAFSPSLSQLF
jgi:hypothetical protein